MTFYAHIITAKTCRPSTTTLPLNCFWQSAPRAARTTGALRQRLRPSVVETLRTLKAFGASLEVGHERFNSSEILRLYEARDYPLRKSE